MLRDWLSLYICYTVRVIPVWHRYNYWATTDDDVFVSVGLLPVMLYEWQLTCWLPASSLRHFLTLEFWSGLTFDKVGTKNM